MKTCTKCKELKPLDQFNKNNQSKDGYRPDCKECVKGYYKKNDEERLAYLRDYAKANRSKQQGYRAKWEAKQYGLDLDPSLMPDGAWEAMKVYYGQCVKCGSKDELTIDHVKPIARGGEHTLLNAQVLCLSCNSRKKDKTEDYRGTARLVDCIGY